MTLRPDEARQLREALESGQVARAADVAKNIEKRDAALGRSLLAEIRAFRIDPLLDLLERGGSVDA